MQTSPALTRLMKSTLRVALGSAIITVGSLSASHAQSYLYATDYFGKQVVRFDGITGAGVPPTPFVNTAPRAAQAVHSYGSTLLVTQPFDDPMAPANYLSKYDISTGGFLSEISVGDSIYELAVNGTGSLIYASRGASIDALDFATGAVVHTSAATRPWDVAINPVDGLVYVTEGWDTGSNAVYKYSTDLSVKTLVVGPTSTPLNGFAGIAFKSDGTFYVVSGGNADPSYATDGVIYHYDGTGSLLSSFAGPAGALLGAFDGEIGPDGNLYVSSVEGACVVRFDTATDTFKDIFVAPHASGLVSSKSLHFAGSPVPEPGSIAFLIGAGISGAGFIVRRRRK